MEPIGGLGPGLDSFHKICSQKFDLTCYCFYNVARLIETNLSFVSSINFSSFYYCFIPCKSRALFVLFLHWFHCLKPCYSSHCKLACASTLHSRFQSRMGVRVTLIQIVSYICLNRKRHILFLIIII